MRNLFEEHSIYGLFLSLTTVCLLHALGAVSIAVPVSNCYAFDNSSRIHDFSSWVGQPFEYDGKDPDLVVRFCKDVETRSSTGYVDFGRYDNVNSFTASSGHVNFVQEYYKGDLRNCELLSYDKMGRTAQVNIVCGSCLNGQCEAELGCICNVKYDSTCRVLVELAIPCKNQGPRVFQGFTVGFHPRSWEIVYNGLTQLGYEKSHHEFSFKTEQTSTSLYMTAIASLSHLVQKPTIKISPEHGLEVSLSGSGATGSPPTTLSPSILMINWRCETVRDTPYEVEVTFPVENYEPIQFTLAKMCEYRQPQGGSALKGWAIFGVLACTLIVFSTLFCCGGFIYKMRVQNQRGLDALPGMTILSACLETVGGVGVGQGYARAEDVSTSIAHQTSWERPPASAQASKRPTKYGAL